MSRGRPPPLARSAEPQAADPLGLFFPHRRVLAEASLFWPILQAVGFEVHRDKIASGACVANTIIDKCWEDTSLGRLSARFPPASFHWDIGRVRRRPAHANGSSWHSPNQPAPLALPPQSLVRNRPDNLAPRLQTLLFPAPAPSLDEAAFHPKVDELLRKVTHLYIFHPGFPADLKMEIGRVVSLMVKVGALQGMTVVDHGTAMRDKQVRHDRIIHGLGGAASVRFQPHHRLPNTGLPGSGLP